MIVDLSQHYTARDGTPTVSRVDVRIFELTYFHHCMSCSFCHDGCCQFGATIEEPKVSRILELASELEPLTGVPRSEWFIPQVWTDDDYPGGRYTRTSVNQRSQGDRCVFLNRDSRGCLLHSFALRYGHSVRDLKPMACNLFPVLWDSGVLIVPDEIDDRTLICRDTGYTLYRSARNDLHYYFGGELVAELDQLESARQPQSRSLPLPLASA